MVVPDIEDFKNDDLSLDFEGFRKAMNEYSQAEKIARLERAVIEDYGIDADTWANTPNEIKSLLADLHRDAEQHAENMYALETWRDEMPI